jgi:hypothetical protein
MNKVLYSRLRQISANNESARRGRTNNAIENDEEKEEILESLEPTLLSSSSKAIICMQTINSFCNDCGKNQYQPLFNELGKSQLENRRTRIFFFLVTLCMIIITIPYLRHVENLMYNQSEDLYHSALPSKITTEADSMINSFLNTSLSDMEPLNFPLPVELQSFDEIVNPLKQGDLPFFFHIPRSGGSTVKDIMSECLGLVFDGDTGGGETQNIMAGIMYSPHLYAGSATLFNKRQNGRCVTFI